VLRHVTVRVLGWTRKSLTVKVKCMVIFVFKNDCLSAGQRKQTLLKLTLLPCSQKLMAGFILSQVSPVSVHSLFIYNTHFNIIFAYTFRNPKRLSSSRCLNLVIYTCWSNHATCPNFFTYTNHIMSEEVVQVMKLLHIHQCLLQNIIQTFCKSFQKQRPPFLCAEDLHWGQYNGNMTANVT
jgi:hypothetical protein